MPNRVICCKYLSKHTLNAREWGGVSAHLMARIRSDIPYGYDDTSRVGFWTPETPEFLEKRDERLAARYANITSYAQAKATIRRVSLANQEASARTAQEHNTRGSIIDFDQIHREHHSSGITSDEDAPRRTRQDFRLSERPFANQPVYEHRYANDFDARPSNDDYRDSGNAGSAYGQRTSHHSARRRDNAWPIDEQATAYRNDSGNLREWEFADDDFDEEQRTRTRRQSIGMRLREARRKQRRRRADRAFSRDYDAPAPEDNGPRAAVDKGKMGRQHQRATRMQAQGPQFSLHLPAFATGIIQSLSLDRIVFRPWFAITGVTIFCAVLLAVGVYPAAQDYYLQIRANDQLAAEYEAIVERNAELENHVQALQTDEGMEELAHESLGWVHEGENSVSVLTDGSANPSTGTLSDTGAVPVGSVPAPETWYSPVLDVVFGYEG